MWLDNDSKSKRSIHWELIIWAFFESKTFKECPFYCLKGVDEILVAYFKALVAKIGVFFDMGSVIIVETVNNMEDKNV